MVKTERKKIHGYEKIQITNDWFTAGITPELGGKILSFSDKYGELFFCFEKFEYLPKEIDRIPDVKEFRKKLRYLPPGGYKTWLAPQDKWAWPPFIELEAGIYTFRIKADNVSSQVEMVSSCCRESEISITRKVYIDNKNELHVYEKITNFGDLESNYGIWGVTQLRRRGKIVVPLGKTKEIILLGGKGWENKTEYIEIDGKYYAIISCNDKTDFKIGTSYSEGWVLTLFEGKESRGYLKRFPVYEKGVTFGHGCAVEIYNSPVFEYFEVEVHAPMELLEKGASAESYEKWSVHYWDINTEYREIVEDILKNKI